MLNELNNFMQPSKIVSLKEHLLLHCIITASMFFYEIHRQNGSYNCSYDNIEWIEETVQVLDNLTKHLSKAKCQSKYQNSRKNSSTSESCLVLLDFTENYSFTSQ